MCKSNNQKKKSPSIWERADEGMVWEWCLYVLIKIKNKVYGKKEKLLEDWIWNTEFLPSVCETVGFILALPSMCEALGLVLALPSVCETLGLIPAVEQGRIFSPYSSPFII